MSVVIFKHTPPQVRPLMIILTAIGLGLLFLGLTLTVLGYYPGYAPYGGNPLQIVGPILLGIGFIILIIITVECCLRSQKDIDDDFEKNFVVSNSGSLTSRRNDATISEHYQETLKKTRDIDYDFESTGYSPQTPIPLGTPPATPVTKSHKTIEYVRPNFVNPYNNHYRNDQKPYIPYQPSSHNNVPMNDYHNRNNFQNCYNNKIDHSLHSNASTLVIDSRNTSSSENHRLTWKDDILLNSSNNGKIDTHIQPSSREQTNFDKSNSKQTLDSSKSDNKISLQQSLTTDPSSKNVKQTSLQPSPPTDSKSGPNVKTSNISTNFPKSISKSEDIKQNSAVDNANRKHRNSKEDIQNSDQSSFSHSDERNHDSRHHKSVPKNPDDSNNHRDRSHDRDKCSHGHSRSRSAQRTDKSRERSHSRSDNKQRSRSTDLLNKSVDSSRILQNEIGNAIGINYLTGASINSRNNWGNGKLQDRVGDANNIDHRNTHRGRSRERKKNSDHDITHHNKDFIESSHSSTEMAEVPYNRSKTTYDRKAIKEVLPHGYHYSVEDHPAGIPYKLRRKNEVSSSSGAIGSQEVLNMSSKTTTVNNPNFTININANAGSAIQIALGGSQHPMPINALAAKMIENIDNAQSNSPLTLNI